MNKYRCVNWFSVCSTVVLAALAGTEAWADGTEVLGTPSIAIQSGTGVVAAGVGAVDQPAKLDVEVPDGSDVKQVILYWSGFFQNDTDAGSEMKILVDGNTVSGKLIGGPTEFFRTSALAAFSATYRADITALKLIDAGSNSVTIDGLDFNHINHGAGVIVIYDDGSNSSDIQIVDGSDTAFVNFLSPLDTTVAKTFTFEASTQPRNADLVLHFGSVSGQDYAGERPTTILVTVGTDEQSFDNVLMSNDGDEWDSLTLPVHIPSGVTSVTVQPLSKDHAGKGKLPASFVWVGAGLSVPLPKVDCGECDGKVTELLLDYLGPEPVLVKILDKKDKNVLFDGWVTAGNPFHFYGMDKKGTLGTEIKLFVDGVLNTKIHTSCSQPIGPGLISGDFKVVSGVSRNGGVLCPLDPPQPVGECGKGIKPQRLTMIYTGEGCGVSNNGQDTKKAVCSGDPALAAEVWIVATNKKSPNDSKAKIWFDGAVSLNGAFDIDAGSGNKLESNTCVFIYNTDGSGGMGSTLLQTLKFHTSCSQPLRIGDQFGSLILEGFIAQ